MTVSALANITATTIAAFKAALPTKRIEHYDFDSTPTRLTVTELQGLVDRLVARARSTMFSDQPGEKADMAAAAAVVATVHRKMRPGEAFDLVEVNGE